MVDIKSFKGHFLVWALNGHGFRRDVGGTNLPYVRHLTKVAAIEAAKLLNDKHPETTFVVIQEVARVKAKRLVPTTGIAA